MCIRIHGLLRYLCIIFCCAAWTWSGIYINLAQCSKYPCNRQALAWTTAETLYYSSLHWRTTSWVMNFNPLFSVVAIICLALPHTLILSRHVRQACIRGGEEEINNRKIKKRRKIKESTSWQPCTAWKSGVENKTLPSGNEIMKTCTGKPESKCTLLQSRAVPSIHLLMVIT